MGILLEPLVMKAATEAELPSSLWASSGNKAHRWDFLLPSAAFWPGLLGRVVNYFVCRKRKQTLYRYV